MIVPGLLNEKGEELAPIPSFTRSLMDFIDEEEAQELGVEEEEGFRIESADQANYFVKKLKEVREEMTEASETAQAQLDAYHDKVERWLGSTLSPLEYQERRLVSLLESYAVETLEGSSKRSMKLVEGTLQFRKQTPEYVYDEEALLAFVEANAKTYVKTKASVDKTLLKKDAKVVNGRLFIGETPVEGVAIVDRGDKFDIK